MTFRVQNQIRQNASDIRNYLDDLFSWEDEINKGKKPTKPSKQNNKENHPIRGQALEEETQNGEEDQNLTESRENEDKQLTEEEKNLIRDKSTIPNYYKAWDKFDVDKELNKLEKQEDQRQLQKKEQKPPQPVNPMQKTSGADRNMKIVVKGGRSSYNEVESLKEKGNLFFKSLEFSKAVEMYSECIIKGEEQKANKEIMTVVYSNRAMAYLKLREFLKAEEDCSKALLLNDKHVKSLVRRGTARRKLEKHREALKDFQKAGEVEPENKEVQEEVRTTLKRINTIKEEQKKKMVLPMSMTSKPKVSIKVKDFDSEKTEQTEENAATASIEKSDKVPIEPSTNNEITKPSVPSSVNAASSSNVVVSDFITLKDVEGKVVRHKDHVNEEEAIKQKVHFRLDLNTEDRNINKTYRPVQLDKVPKKPSLKRKRQFSKEPDEPVKPAKKVTDVSELKTAKAVLQGKEIWHKQVIEEYEKTSKPTEERKKQEEKKVYTITTSNEFLNTWKHIKDSQEACEKLLLGQGKPERFAELFKAGIDFDYYIELIRFGQKILSSNKELTLEILQGLSKVKRFEINVKSMLSSEKKVVREIIDRLKEEREINKESLEEITQKYKV